MFQSEELHETPAPRTHDETMQQAKKAEQYRGADDHHPKHSHGIRGICPLGLLPFFNLIWDLCPDMMHINKNLWDRCIVALFRGKRDPTKSKKNPNPGRFYDSERKNKEPAEKKQKTSTLEERRTAHRKKLATYTIEHNRYTEALDRAHEWTLPEAAKKSFDKRVRAIAESSLIPFSLVPCRTIPGRKKS